MARPQFFFFGFPIRKTHQKKFFFCIWTTNWFIFVSLVFCFMIRGFNPSAPSLSGPTTITLFFCVNPSILHRSWIPGSGHYWWQVRPPVWSRKIIKVYIYIQSVYQWFAKYFVSYFAVVKFRTYEKIGGGGFSLIEALKLLFFKQRLIAFLHQISQVKCFF